MAVAYLIPRTVKPPTPPLVMSIQSSVAGQFGGAEAPVIGIPSAAI